MSMKDDIADNGEDPVLIGLGRGDLKDYIGHLTDRFQSLGARHILITGLPLPGKDLGNLILHQSWATSDSANMLPFVKGSDPLLKRIASLSHPRNWHLAKPDHSWLHDSSFIRLLKQSSFPSDSFQDIVGIHVHSFSRVQIAICLAGTNLGLTDKELVSLGCRCQVEFDELYSNRQIKSHRPGELSSRERHVLSLTAQGKTAGDIAEELQISQRTVHAHLQNASDKMQASNKTQTVIEAVRYGQIELG